MTSTRFLSVSPENEPLWVHLYVHEIEEVWATMNVGDDGLPPQLGELNGITFFGGTSQEAEQGPLAYRGYSEPVN